MGGAGKDHTLDLLLELHGDVYFVDDKQSYWVKFEVHRVGPTAERPHGIAYALTLHGPSGDRILGYDNAHVVKGRRGPGSRSSGSHDHRHRLGTVRPYRFVDAGTLIEDFWNDVDQMLKELGVKK